VLEIIIADFDKIEFSDSLLVINCSTAKR